MKKSFAIISLLTLLCFNIKAQTITFNLLHAPCNNDGVLVIQTTGMTPPISFNYYENYNHYTVLLSSVNDTLSNYSGGWINANIYDTLGHQASSTYNGHQPFIDSIYSTHIVCPAVNNATAYIVGGGTTNMVQWYSYSQTGPAYVTTGNPVTLQSGQYFVVITDANGCTSTSNLDSVFYQSPVNYVISSTNANCTNGTATTSPPSGGISPYTYLWSNGSTSSSISGLMMGSYNITVTDAQGCYNNQYLYINQLTSIGDSSVVTPATCLNNDGSIITFGYGGVSPYSYLWSSGQTTQTISGLPAGVYNVTVQDANGCIGNGQGYIPSSTPITVTYSSTSSLCTAATGTATLNITGGTLPYTINWSTFPVQTTATATNLSPGDYAFTVTDSVGCVQSGTVHVPAVSIVTASIATANTLCLLQNGSASMIMNSGTAPYTYIWSNGATSAAINGIPSGAYSCTVTDAMHCSVTKQTYVYQGSPLSLYFSTADASCIFVSDGTATVNVLGGTPPLTYFWSNGSTSSTAVGLATGWYWLTVHDASGCATSENVFVNYNHANNSCYCTVTGKVYDDANANCTLDAGETGIQNIMMHLSGQGYTFTDAQGNYSFIVPSGSYTLSENVGGYYPLAGCQNNNIVVNVTAAAGCTDTINIANVINPIHDIGIYTTYYTTPPIPGNVYYQNVIVNNEGTVSEPSILMGYKHDGQLNYSSVSPGLFTQLSPALAPDWYSIASSFPTLAPHTTQSFTLQYNVPANIPINTEVNFNDSAVYISPMSNWLSDYTPWNNVDAYSTNVVGAWDPNQKEVSPKGTCEVGYIGRADSVLTYTIHFQNTGNYNAQNIYLIDSLSSNLNIATLKPVYSNHSFTTSVSETGVVKFTFNNIYLPYNPPSSIGELIYTIHLKPNLADFTQIKNTANIYFDYNAPVCTNTTLNTINHSLGIASLSNSNNDIMIYPNPSTGLFTVSSLKHKVQNIKVLNILGEEVLQSTINNQQTIIDLSGYRKGLYFVQITDENKNMVNRKIVVE